jgi:tRNA threonylcarbamoyladenosine biosynthesis protein TsaB
MNRFAAIAIETSSKVGSIALAINATVRDQQRLPADQRHAAELIPALQAMLQKAAITPRDVSLLSWSHGPGSFTGLRIAATVARMFQWVTDCRVVGVPTLEVLARNALSAGDYPPRIAVITPARRGEVFAAGFEQVGGTTLQPLTDVRMCSPEKFLAEVPPPFCVLGDGVEHHRALCEKYAEKVVAPQFWTPHAAHVAIIGQTLADRGQFSRPEQIEPQYVRRPEVEEVYEKRRAEARRRRGE